MADNLCDGSPKGAGVRPPGRVDNPQFLYPVKPAAAKKAKEEKAAAAKKAKEDKAAAAMKAKEDKAAAAKPAAGKASEPKPTK